VDQLFFPVRQGPDYPFWKKISLYTAFNEKRKGLEKQMEKERNLEKKDEIQR